MLRVRSLVLVLSLSFSSWSGSAFAQSDDPQTRSAGRKLAQDGVALLQQGQAPQASEKLEKAYQLLPVPSVALWSGRALAARGLLVEASERYVEASRLSGFKGDLQVQLDAQKEAARELESLTPRIPTLLVAVVPSPGERPSVTLDGKPVPTALWGEEQPVNPGSHELVLESGSKQVRKRVALAEAEKKRETLSLDDGVSTTSPALDSSGADGQKSGSPRRTLGFVALAAGGAGLIVGGVAGGLALSKHGSLEDGEQCRGDVCLEGARADVDSLDTLRAVSTVGFVAGGVLAATGVVLLLTSKPSPSARAGAPTLALRLTPSRVQLTGAF